MIENMILALCSNVASSLEVSGGRMSSVDIMQLHVFLSYTHADDTHHEGDISWLRDTLETKVRKLTGNNEFRIFQDVDIQPGEIWSDKIDQALERAHLFIPILTHHYFKSDFCRGELTSFLKYEARVSRKDLILPIYLTNAKSLDDRDCRAGDILATQLYKRKHKDWRRFAFDLRGRDADVEISNFAKTLAKRTEAETQNASGADDQKSKLHFLLQAVGAGRVNREFLWPPAVAVRGRHKVEIGHSHSPQLAQTPGFLSKDDEELIEESRRLINDSKRRLKRQPWLVGLFSVAPFLLIAAGLYFWSPTLVSEQSQRAFVKLQQALKTDVDDNSIYSFEDCGRCPEMMALPSGSFLMGSPDTEEGRNDDEGPQHEVKIGYLFALSKHEVTCAQFEDFVSEEDYEAKGCRFWDNESWPYDSNRSWRNPGYEQTDDDPVVCVSWEGARAYVRWLSKRTGEIYRLPSEAEWEYAVRAGSTTQYFWGEDADTVCDYANVFDKIGRKVNRFDRFASLCDDKHPQTAPVGSYSANEFGLHDMAGNVWEWVEDPRHGSYEGAPIDGSAWAEGGSSWRINRGGSWGFNPWNLRSANRRAFEPDERYFDIGFRVARTIHH